MSTEIMQFLISFVVAVLWYRVLSVVAPFYMKRPLTRSVLKLHWHHLHHGILITLFAVVLLLFFGQSFVVIILLGVGLGLMIDLFIPSLLLKTDRKEELLIYRKSLLSTLLLSFSVFVIIIVLAGLF